MHDRTTSESIREAKEHPAPDHAWSSQPKTLFAPPSLVRRIERAEAHFVASVAEACRQRGYDVVLAELGGGVAVYLEPDSPFNKLAGVGFATLDERSLTEIERVWHARGAAVQLELSTFADPAVARLLVQRQYELVGFEHVLGRDLRGYALEPIPSGISIVRAESDQQLEAWGDTVVVGFGAPDESDGPAAIESFDSTQLKRAFRAMSSERSLECWIAELEGHIVGGASMRLDAGIAQLNGAATHPSWRRRGVQTALLRARLQSASSRGAELAVVTTQPGSRSQENTQRAGFSLLYARAIWVRRPSP